MFFTRAKNLYKTLSYSLVALCGLAFVPAAFAGQPSIEVVEVQSQSMVPVVRDVMPIYPKSMLKRGLEGRVTLAYEIDKRGKAKNFRVLDTEPTRIFIRSAKIALKKSRFEVTKAHGRPVKVRDQQRSYVYSLVKPPYVAAVTQ